MAASAQKYDQREVSIAAPVDTTTRGRLLEAAAEVFCERGYERTTVAEVARRAGLTTGAIYANFRDKAELLFKAIERDSETVVSDMEAARHAGVGAADRLRLMARRMVSQPDLMQRSLFVEMVAAARRDPDLGRRVAQLLQAMEEELAHLLGKAQRDGELGAQWDPAVLARFCLALGVGYTQLAVAGLPDPSAGKWAELTSHMVSSLQP